MQDIRRPAKKAIQPVPVKRKFPYKYLMFAAGIVLVIAVVMLLWPRKRSAPNLNSVEVIKYMVAEHMVLPANEQPALVTVVDKNKVNTKFLKQSENGDKVLIYQNNKKAIIYRPSINKIIDIGPVLIDTPTETSQ
jgi:hypothetical protein